MKINKLNWAICPHCEIELNGWQYYPANLMLDQSLHNFPFRMRCPNTNCGKLIAVKAEVSVVLEAVKSED